METRRNGTRRLPRRKRYLAPVARLGVPRLRSTNGATVFFYCRHGKPAECLRLLERKICRRREEETRAWNRYTRQNVCSIGNKFRAASSRGACTYLQLGPVSRGTAVESFASREIDDRSWRWNNDTVLFNNNKKIIKESITDKISLADSHEKSV